MEEKLAHLLEDDVNFDPLCHPFALELANLVEGGGRGGEGAGEGAEKEGGSDEDVQVGEVKCWVWWTVGGGCYGHHNGPSHMYIRYKYL